MLRQANGRVGFVRYTHLNDSKPPGLPALAIIDHFRRGDVSCLREVRLQLFLGRWLGQMSYINSRLYIQCKAG